MLDAVPKPATDLPHGKPRDALPVPAVRNIRIGGGREPLLSPSIPSAVSLCQI